MRIYFATNRNPQPLGKPTRFGGDFSPQGLTDLRFGWADFDAAGKKYKLNIAGESLTVPPAALDRGDLSAQKLGSRAVFEAIRQDMAAQHQDCLLYIHGFNVDFNQALQSALALKQHYAARPMTVCVFTWPSDGSLLPFKAYASDRDDARASGVALGRGLQKLASYLRGIERDQYCGQNVHLLAHSMGNYALRWAFQDIRRSTGANLRRLLDQLLLFAADEDHDAFEYDYKLAGLADMARRVTVYHNANDRALVVSDYTKGNPDRLGASGPRNSRLLPDKVTVVDCEPVVDFSRDVTGHSYYLGNPVVTADVLAVLDGVEPERLVTRSYRADTRGYRLLRP
jgi:esterase/lipase superfamily enzyme